MPSVQFSGSHIINTNSLDRDRVNLFQERISMLRLNDTLALASRHNKGCVSQYLIQCDDDQDDPLKTLAQEFNVPILTTDEKTLGTMMAKAMKITLWTELKDTSRDAVSSFFEPAKQAWAWIRRQRN